MLRALLFTDIMFGMGEIVQGVQMLTDPHSVPSLHGPLIIASWGVTPGYHVGNCPQVPLDGAPTHLPLKIKKKIHVILGWI